MKQITIIKNVSERLERKPNLTWNDMAGLSWIFLDNDFEESYFTKKGEVETKY